MRTYFFAIVMIAFLGQSAIAKDFVSIEKSMKVLPKYELYRKKVLEKSHNDYISSLENLVKLENEQKEKQLQYIRSEKSKIETRYQNLLKESSGEQKLNIYFNLALINFYSSMYLDSEKISLLEKAMEYLSHIPLENKYFVSGPALLKATIFEQLGQKEESVNLYRFISKSNNSNRLDKMLATIYYADDLFKKNQFVNSSQLYESALNSYFQMKSPENKDKAILSDIHYRLMWSYYRSFLYKKSGIYALKLLGDENSSSNYPKMTYQFQDALELMADICLEMDSKSYVLDAYNRINSLEEKVNLGLMVSYRYLERQKLKKSISTLAYLLDNFSLSEKFPEVVKTLADNYGKIEDEGKKYRTLSILFHIFDKNSLWRSKHSELVFNTYINNKNYQATLVETAEYFYSYSLKSENSSKIEESISQYLTLVDVLKSTNYKKEVWNLKLANLYFYKEDFAKAIFYYNTLKENANADQKIQKIAYSQIVNSKYRVWKRYSEEMKSTLAWDKTEESRLFLEFNTEFKSYLNSKYFDENASIVAVGAELLAENNYPTDAVGVWRQVLLSKAGKLTKQRNLKSLIQHYLKTKDYSTALSVIEEFSFIPKIKPENEIIEIYEKTLSRVFIQIKKQEGVLSGADFLFKKMDSYDRFLTSSDRFYVFAYKALAVSSSWNLILSKYEEHVNRKLKIVSVPQIKYVYNLALDGAMKYEEALEGHYAFIRKYPNFIKNTQIIDRIILTSGALEKYQIGAKTALIASDKARSNKNSVKYLKIAKDFFDKEENYESSVIALEKLRKKVSKYQLPDIDLQLAKAYIRLKDSKKSQKYLFSAIKLTKNQSVRQNNIKWKSIISESYYLLGLNELNNFVKVSRADNYNDFKKEIRFRMNRLKKIGSWNRNIYKYGEPSEKIRSQALMFVISKELSTNIKDFVYRKSKVLSTSQSLSLNSVANKLLTISNNYRGKIKLSNVYLSLDTINDKSIDNLFEDKSSFSKLVLNVEGNIYLPPADSLDRTSNSVKVH